MEESLQIDDPKFDVPASLREAYLIMIDFIRAYHERGERSTLDVLSDTQIGVWADRGDGAKMQNRCSTASGKRHSQLNAQVTINRFGSIRSRKSAPRASQSSICSGGYDPDSPFHIIPTALELGRSLGLADDSFIRIGTSQSCPHPCQSWRR